MLLTISTSHVPATDLGFLLHKHPDRVHEIDLPFGAARVLYPEATDERCTAALVVDVDPVGLVRTRTGPRGRDSSLQQYVNDRPYAASSFLSVALGKCFGTAMAGRSKDRPELAGTAMAFVAKLPVVPCRGGETLLRRLFEPLGYTVAAEALALDTQFPEWGDSPYLAVELQATMRLRDLLEHLFVLLPVLDDDKHYSTPNVEYNTLFDGLAAGALRHRDHRFEWTRAELAAWATQVAGRHGYRVELSGIGPADPERGQPTQMAVFTR